MVPKICSVDGCEKPSRSRGMCPMHYTRYRRHGDPSARLPNSKPVPMSEVLRKHAPKRPQGECWKWTGPLDKAGYGLTYMDRPDGRRVPGRAHRAIYEHLVGPIPEGLLLMHSCDNPPCVNPEHLSPGTWADNLGDMAAKGRSARGERNGHARLTESSVKQVLELAAQGAVKRDIAAKFGVQPTSISAILHGRAWNHVTGFPKVKRRAA